jgi:hypothetical protein
VQPVAAGSRLHHYFDDPQIEPVQVIYMVPRSPGKYDKHANQN